MIKIKTDSRLVKEGDVFVAIKGEHFDGHDYIEEAINRGASRIVCERGKYSVPTLVVENSINYLTKLLTNEYSRYFGDVKFIGITGTNGKTTTAYLVSQILTNLGVSNAYVGTIGYYLNSEKVRDLPNTTPDILSLYNLIFESMDEGAKVIVMEVSSHALELNRISGIKFDAAAFTNLTEDHLDFHKNMENYLKCKLKIINYMKDNGIMVVNTDDEYSKRFEIGKYKTIGINSDADYNVFSYKFDEGTKLNFEYDNRNYFVRNSLLGKFNVYNYMMALAIVNSFGVDIKKIISVTNELQAPTGRNEVIKVGKSKAIIDYAHTPDAVFKIINSTRESAKGKIYTIIGCGGDRDKKKRSIMGEIATRLSDFVIFTDDNPRSENEEAIMEDILKGVKNDNYIVIYDREEAIKNGLAMLSNDDTLLVLGKGHEEYQLFGNEKVYFSDRKVIDKYNDYKVLIK